MKRPTINDVAERANVSKSTVSHVINNTRTVDEETKQRVLTVISELSYRPSLGARSLTTNRTGIIGVIVSDTTNTFFGDLLRGVEDILQPKNYSIIVCNTDEILERENNYIELLLRQRVDGILAAATSQKWAVLNLANEQRTPVIFLDRSYDGLDGPYVGANNHAGAYLGTTHLIECGHKKIGILAGFQRLSSMRERLTGFREALQDHKIFLRDEWVIESPLGIDFGRGAALKILGPSDRPSALFVSNNMLSLGALLALKELGLRCPEEISLVGFDDHPWSAVSCPPLTVVRQPSRRLGQVSAEMMLALINGEQLPNERVILDCELVIRESCSGNFLGHSD
jgi:DNA-binding LacI/PurR family transcriptional regulator